MNLTFVVPHHNRNDILEGLQRNLDIFKKKYPVIITMGGVFGKNCNLGASGVKTKWIGFLNDDVRFTDESILDKMMATNADIVGCMIEPHCTGVYFDENGDWRGVTSATPDESKVKYPNGCFFLMKKKVFDALKGFDPLYRMGHEDIDMYLRAEKAGYTIKIIPDRVVHFQSLSENRMKWHEENCRIFNERWGPKYKIC